MVQHTQQNIKRDMHSKELMDSRRDVSDRKTDLFDSKTIDFFKLNNLYSYYKSDQNLFDLNLKQEKTKELQSEKFNESLQRKSKNFLGSGKGNLPHQIFSASKTEKSHGLDTDFLFNSLANIFREEASMVQQIDIDFPEYHSTEATKEDCFKRMSPVGTHATNTDLLLKLCSHREKEVKIAEIFSKTVKVSDSFLSENIKKSVDLKEGDDDKMNIYISSNAQSNKNKETLNKKAPVLTSKKFLSDIPAINAYFEKYLTGVQHPTGSNVTVLICQDQEGSRFIQNIIDGFSTKEVSLFFSEIEEHALELSTNLFGNYVIQKIISLLSDSQREKISHKFRKNIYVLSTHVYGCRVIQKLIDHTNEIDFIIEELQDHIIELIASPNGNHVIQKCIDRAHSSKWTSAFINRIIWVFEADCINLAQQRYGCRVLQRLFEINSAEKVAKLLDITVENTGKLINDRYGNYVIQHLIQTDFNHKEVIFSYIIENAVELSKFKFSSNVIEKCICKASKKQLTQFLSTFSQLQEGKPALFYMCTDMYANYVVQKFYDTVDEELKEKMKVMVGKFLKDIKVIPFTKHILSKLS